jgi:hypothetical protein
MADRVSKEISPSTLKRGLKRMFHRSIMDVKLLLYDWASIEQVKN